MSGLHRAGAFGLLALLALQPRTGLSGDELSLGDTARVFAAGPRHLGADAFAQWQWGQAPYVELGKPQAPPPGRPLLDARSGWLTAGVLIVTPILGYFAWWRDEPTDHFVVAHENWFGSTTYAGGADKVSHLWAGWAGQHLMENAYRALGRTDREARILSVAVTSLAGVLVEAGDGFSIYGAAWEDAAMNVAGALASSQVGRLGLRDTVGIRLGRVPTEIPDPCCRFGGYGANYSKELYTLDLKLAGFLPRVDTRPGAARFLLVSLAYGSRGYRFSPEYARQRNIGIEVGLNVSELLRAAGVPADRWWGSALLSVLSYVRLPYTSLGLYYDMNHGTWWGGVYGPGYDPGFIIYD